MNELKNIGTDSLWFSITKQDLLNMSEEELKIVESFVEKYYRGRYRLYPKSLFHFIRDQKYEGDCVACVLIPLNEMIKRGILTTSVEEGKMYWYLYGEKLDPKTYEKLYKMNQETVKTLLEELGLKEFMNKFNISLSSVNSINLFTFEYGGLHFDVDYHHEYTPTPKLRVYTHPNISLVDNKLPNPPISIYIVVENPKVEDVYRIEKLVKELKSDIEQKINKISSWIKKNYRYSFSEEDVSIFGVVSVKNYEFDTYNLSISIYYKLDDRSSFTASVQFYTPHTINLTLSQVIKSRYLVNALREIDSSVIQIVKDAKEYTIRSDVTSSSVTFEFIGKYSVDPDLENLPDISKEIDTIMNMKTILNNIIEKKLDKIRDKEVIIYDESYSKGIDYYGTVDDFMKFINWRKDQSAEESILKVWLLKKYIAYCRRNVKSINPDLISLFISLAYLGGAPYDYTLEKINEGLDYVVKLARRGRLRIINNEMYLDGKKVEINPFDTNTSTFINMVTELISVLSSEEEEKSMEISKSKKISI
ncbi:MAG: hypothetical protein QW611_05090 [Ignisphaera sp.]